MVLSCRLEHWFRPYREQAGAQWGRGCIEHILTLVTGHSDYARKKKKKLLVTFVDFSQAYDKVPRDIMLRVLRRSDAGDHSGHVRSDGECAGHRRVCHHNGSASGVPNILPFIYYICKRSH